MLLIRKPLTPRRALPPLGTRWWLLVTLACAGLIGCGDGGSSVSATANVPAQFSRVFITVEALWVNKKANAAFDDPDWLKFPLDEPQTLDLVNLTNGALAQFATEQPLPPDTYRSMRLFLSTTEGSLRRSARAAGAIFNNEVGVFDTNGMQRQVALAVVNKTQGIAIPIELEVEERGRNFFTATSTTSTATGTAATSSTDSNTGLGSRITSRAALVFDAARDITAFTYSDVLGFVLNPSLVGRDLEKVGSITGQLNIGAIPLDPNTGRPDITVTAQTLSADESRRVPVLSASVNQDGSFTLFPFPFDPDDDEIPTYDLVIHGPRVQTTIIRSAPVTMGSSGTAIMTGVTLAATPAFAINIDDDQRAAPRGARIGFYQTLPGNDDAPFLIEEKLLDPLSGQFAIDQLLPTGNVQVASFNGNTLGAFDSLAPDEGTSNFRVAATTSVHGDGAFGATITPTGTNTTREIAGPTVGVPANTVTSTITATINVTTPGRFNRGAILITQDGALVDAVRIDTLLSQATGTVVVNTIPGGSTQQPFARGLYFAEVFVWRSDDAQDSFRRQPSDMPIDLRASNAATVSVTVN